MPVATETAPFTKRIEKLRKLMRAQELPALLVQKEVHVHYLTGFTGEDSMLLVTPTRTILLTDFRFTTQLADECPDLELHVRRSGKAKETMDQSIAIVADKLKLGTIAIESDVMTIGFLQKVQEQAKHTMFIMSSGLIDQLRVIKDRTEITEIRTAIRIAEQAWLDTVSCLNPELTEIQVAHILEDNIRKQGGSGFSFDPIIAAGPRSALPHGRASQTKIGSSNWLLFDWGAKYGRRISDLTRTIYTGKISAKLERIYQVVYKAQIKAIATIRPGITCGKVDLAARGTIEKAGFGDYFGHGLGHGIGLEVHEQPRFNAGAETILEPGMIVTVEPGIYLPGVGGVRLEDNILVTKTGHEVLSSLPKTWEEARFEWCRAA